MDRAQLALLASRGMSFADGITPVEMRPEWRQDFGLAMDAQPTLTTTSSQGIPAFLSNIIDPEVIRIVFTPTRAAEIYGEEKKGDWTTFTAQFPIVESTGQVTSYGDFNNNGNVGANINWTPRQAYTFQTVERYGEREIDLFGLAKLNYKAELDTAAGIIMNKFFNLSYVYGISGLQNYGVLNDPSLLPPIAPAVKAAGGTAWVSPNSAGATAPEIYNDVLALYTQLVVQMGSNVDMQTPMVLVLSTIREAALSRVSAFNITARQTIKENFPNLTIKTMPEMTTTAGEYMQLFLPTVDGAKTWYTAFTEKNRSHAVVPDLSSWKQKKSGGTWGAILRRPIAVTGMIGI